MCYLCIIIEDISTFRNLIFVVSWWQNFLLHVMQRDKVLFFIKLMSTSSNAVYLQAIVMND